MGKITINTEKLTKEYAFEGNGIVIKGQVMMIASSRELQTHYGSCYQSSDNGQSYDLVGTFNGKLKDGEMKYEYTQMPRRIMLAVLDAIDEIETTIIN